MRQAHRIAWELTYGSPPAGLLRTTCGNLRCVGPDHHVVVDRKVGPANRARTPDKRFESMVSLGPDGWLWTGSTDHLAMVRPRETAEPSGPSTVGSSSGIT